MNFKLNFEPKLKKYECKKINFWNNLYEYILKYLNIHFYRDSITTVFPYKLNKIMYLPNIYKSYIPYTDSNNEFNFELSDTKIVNARIEEHQRIRELLSLYRNNEDKNKVFPFDLAYRIFTLNNTQLLECLHYDHNYEYKREYNFISDTWYRDTFNKNTNFIDVECSEHCDLQLYKIYKSYELIAPRDYVIEKSKFCEVNS